jgi:glycosyltransferase involved in cell wall biosynthesis
MYWVRSDIHRQLLKVQLSACDSIVAVSNATRSQLVERVGVAPSKVTVAATGVSPRWLDLGTDPASEPLRLVWVGSLSKEKDPALALEAFIEADVAGSTLRFVGDGPLRSELEARAVPGVEFVGAVSDVAPHLEQAGALLLSSRTEGLPGVVLEALGAGLPVIGTAVGGVEDVVIDDETGHLVASGDAGAMADRIRRLAADPAGRARMGAAGRRLVGESYLLSHSIDRYDAALRNVLKGATS